MKEIAPYTQKFVFRCTVCGFEVVSGTTPSSCPACGTAPMPMTEDCLRPLREFVEQAFLPLPHSDCRLASVPVTQVVWRIVTGRPLETPFLGDALPASSVSWEDCREFLERLNARPETRAAGWTFRLPTVAEWKAAARRGRRKFENLAWHWDNSGGFPHPVGEKGANPLGFFDLFGNVWEWCEDGDDREKVCMGGCWCCDEDGCRQEERWPSDTRRSFIGVRLCAGPRK